MKKLIIAALAAATLATPAMAAPYGYDGYGKHGGYGSHGDHGGWNKGHGGWGSHHGDFRRWSRGDRFDYRFARDYRVIGNPYRYRLHAAPYGYRWVRSGRDAVLIGITSGLVLSVMDNVFYY